MEKWNWTWLIHRSAPLPSSLHQVRPEQYGEEGRWVSAADAGDEGFS